jgi:hypothetical protein
LKQFAKEESRASADGCASHGRVFGGRGNRRTRTAPNRALWPGVSQPVKLSPRIETEAMRERDLCMGEAEKTPDSGKFKRHETYECF